MSRRQTKSEFCHKPHKEMQPKYANFCATCDKNDPLKSAKPHGDSHRKNHTPLSHLCTKKICPCEGHNRIYCASDSTAIVDELPMITILLNGVMRQGELGDVG